MAVMTWVIVAVTCAVSLALTFSGNENLAIAAGGVIPARVSGLIVMPPYLAVVPAWLTPLSATLVHAGPVHLGFNMLMLAQTGRLVERLLGPARVALIYLLGAYAAAAAQWALDPASMSPMVGASGAVSAVLGSYAMFFSRRKARAIGPIPGRVVDIAWIAGGRDAARYAGGGRASARNGSDRTWNASGRDGQRDGRVSARDLEFGLCCGVRSQG